MSVPGSSWGSMTMHSKKTDVLLERIRKRRADKKSFRFYKLPSYAFKFIQKVSPEMATILIGMRDGMVSLGYICILLILILYIYAVAGCVFFQKNDMWHFRSVEIAFISLLRCGFFDGWGDILYINYYGCDVYTMDVYTSDPEEKSDKLGGVYYCNPNPYEGDKFGSQPQPILTVLYLGSFLFIVALAVLSLIIGAIGDAMMNASLEMKKNTFARKIVWQQSDAQTVVNTREETLDYNRTQLESIRLLKLALNGENIFRKRKFAFTKQDFWYKIRKNGEILCYYCGVIADSVHYENFMIFTIISTAVLAGLQTMKGQTQQFVEVTDALNWVIQSIFTFDCAIKIAAEGKRPYHYFYDNWNNFDFLLVVVAYADAGGLIQFQPLFLRLFRLFRVLKLLKRFRQLQVIINAITGCSLSVAIIGAFFIIYLIVYAAIGVAMFGKDDRFHFGTLYMGILSVFQSATYDNFSSVMYVSLYGCEQFEYPGVGDWSKYCVDPPPPNFIGAYVYFLFNAIVGGCVLINLFIGLMCSAMIDSYDNLELYTKTDALVHRIGIKNKLPNGLVHKYRQIFELLDVTNGDRLGLVELMYGYRLSGGSTDEEDIKKIFVLVDTDMSQYIEFHEFIVFMLHIHHDKYTEKTRTKIDKIRKSISNSFELEFTEDIVEQYKRSSIRNFVQNASAQHADSKLSRQEKLQIAEMTEKLQSIHALADLQQLAPGMEFTTLGKSISLNSPRESIFLNAAGGGSRKSTRKSRTGSDKMDSPYSAPDTTERLSSSGLQFESSTPPAALIRSFSIKSEEQNEAEVRIVESNVPDKKADVTGQESVALNSKLKRYSKKHSSGILKLAESAKLYKATIENGFKAKEAVEACSKGTNRYETKLRTFMNIMSELDDAFNAFNDCYSEQADHAPQEILAPLTKFQEERTADKFILEDYRTKVMPEISDIGKNDVSPSRVAFDVPHKDDQGERLIMLDSARSGVSSSMHSSDTSYHSETDDDHDDHYLSDSSGASSLEHGVNFIKDDDHNYNYMPIDDKNRKDAVIVNAPTQAVNEVKDAQVEESVPLLSSDSIRTREQAASPSKPTSIAQFKIAKEKASSEITPPMKEPTVAEGKSSSPAKKSSVKKSPAKAPAKEGKQSKQSSPDKKSPSPKKSRAKPPPPSTPSPNASPAPKQAVPFPIQVEEIQQDEQKWILNVLKESPSSSKTQAWTTTVEPEEEQTKCSRANTTEYESSPDKRPLLTEQLEEKERSGKKGNTEGTKLRASEIGKFEPRVSMSASGKTKDSPSPLKVEQLEDKEYRKVQVIGSKQRSPDRKNSQFKPRAPKTPPPNSSAKETFSPSSSSAFISPSGDIDAEYTIDRLTSTRERAPSEARDGDHTEVETAFVYIKPHANTPLTRQICTSFFKSKGVEVAEEGDVKGTDVDSEMMFDKQYFKFADYAFGNAHEFKLRKENLNEFRQKFGVDFDEVANDGLVLNCVEACDLLQWSNEQLSNHWEMACKEGKCIQLGSCCYCAQFDAEGDGETIIYVVNGFFKSMRASYVDPNSSIHYYCLTWITGPENKDLTIRKFNNLIGETVPSTAAADSLRGLLYANHKNLGLKNPPSNENNFLHASKSIYESLVERSRWTVMPLKKDPFGNRLVESQTPLRKISWWITNPVLLDQDLPKKIRGKRASELLYGLGSDEAYHASMSILSRKLTSIK